MFYIVMSPLPGKLGVEMLIFKAYNIFYYLTASDNLNKSIAINVSRFLYTKLNYLILANVYPDAKDFQYEVT